MFRYVNDKNGYHRGCGHRRGSVDRLFFRYKRIGENEPGDAEGKTWTWPREKKSSGAVNPRARKEARTDMR